jgi:hypothetical protein
MPLQRRLLLMIDLIIGISLDPRKFNGHGILIVKVDFKSMIVCGQDELYVRQQRYLAADVLFCSQLQRQFEFHVRHGV